MSKKTEATVKIVVNAQGVKVVQFCGQDWQDEEEASRIYARIRPLIQEMDRLLKAWQSGLGGVH